VNSPTRALALTVLVACLPTAGCGDPEVEVDEAGTSAGSTAESIPEPALGEPTTRELPGGLVVHVRRPGRGPEARTGDRVSVHYTARISGSETVVESTRSSGIPFEFTLGRREVVRGLERALQGCRAGAELEVEIPAALAYGEAGHGDVPSDTDLTFEIELVRIH